MKAQPKLGAVSAILVAVIALFAGGLGGLVAGSLTEKSTLKSATPLTASRANLTGSSVVSELPLSWSDVAQRASPGVVLILNQQKSQRSIFGDPEPGISSEGSGFVVDTKGDIVTNDHIIARARHLSVIFSDGRIRAARVMRTDAFTDLAMLKVGAKTPVFLGFGDSSALRVGAPVLAMGSAAGDQFNTATAGIISGLGQSLTEPNGTVLQNLLQTDARIAQVNSGGPLLNDRAEVIGINTDANRGSQSTDAFGVSQDVPASGIGFAIPGNIAHDVALRLAQNKSLAYLGVTYHQISQQSDPGLGVPAGAYLSTVTAGSPAAKAGLRPRDVILRLGARELSDAYQLAQAVAESEPGETVNLRVWRSHNVRSVKVHLGASPNR